MQLYDNALSILKGAIGKVSGLVPLLTALLITVVSLYFRVHLSLHASGDYFIGTDSYRHVRHIRQIVSDGSLPDIDFMRNVPDGVKTRLDTRVFPWLIAQSFKILGRFFPDLTLDLTMALYPAVVFGFSCIIYFFLIQKYFGFLTASLATLAFSISPPLISRTTAGYVDTDSLILFLFLGILLFFSLSLDSLVFSRILICRVIYSGLLGVIGILWLGVGLIAGIIYGCSFLIGVYRGFDRKQVIALILGICLYLGLLLLPSNAYQDGPFEPYTLSAALPAFLLGLLCMVEIIRPKRFQFFSKHRKISISKTLVLIGFPVAYLLYKIRVAIAAFCERLLFPFGNRQIMKSIAELQPMNLNDWWHHYGLLYPIGLIGFFIFVFGNGFQKKELKFRNSRFHLLLFFLWTLWISLTRAFTSFFLRQPLWVGVIVLIVPIGASLIHVPYLFLRNGRKTILPFAVWFLVSYHFSSSALRFSLFFIPVFSLMGGFGFVKVLEHLIPDLREKIWLSFLFILNIIIWLLFFFGLDLFTLMQKLFDANFVGISIGLRLLITIMLSLISLGFLVKNLITEIGTRTAIWKSFVFLATCLLCLSACIGIYSWGIGQTAYLLSTIVLSLISLGFLARSLITEIGARTAIWKSFVFLATCLLCFFAYVGIYGWGIGQTAYIIARRPIERIERFANKIRETTPAGAVVAADWTYGSIINEIGQRATIIDEEQNIAKILSFRKRVIFSKTVEEMLDFLETHNVTHLMLTSEDFLRLNLYWREVNPNQPLDFPFVFPLDFPSVLKLKPLRKSLPVPRFEYALKEPVPIPHQGSVSSERLYISKLVVYIAAKQNHITIPMPPQAFVEENGSVKQLGISKIVAGNQQWYFPEAELPITIWLDIFRESSRPLKEVEVHNAFILTQRSHELNIAKLFLGRGLSPYFEEILMEDNGYAKIWKVCY